MSCNYRILQDITGQINVKYRTLQDSTGHFRAPVAPLIGTFSIAQVSQVTNYDGRSHGYWGIYTIETLGLFDLVTSCMSVSHDLPFLVYLDWWAAFGCNSGFLASNPDFASHLSDVFLFR